MGAAIRLNDLRYRYPGSGWVLNKVNLSITDGEYVFICGANGSGKSTLGYLFNGLIPHFFSGTLEGFAAVNDIKTRESSVSNLFYHVGMVIQNPDAQLFNNTVENEIAFGLESMGLPAREVDRRILEVSQTLHIESLLNRSPMELSGGEKRLVAIASVLCLNPAVIVLDEPYASLDWEGVQRLRNVLRKIHQSGCNVIVIEQRIEDFLYDANRCLITNKGRIIFDGTPQKALEVLRRERLMAQFPKRKYRSIPASETILHARNLTYRANEKNILQNVNITFRRGETVAIVGKNGSGKTTLIKHFNGLLRPTDGEVICQGEKTDKKPPSTLAAQVGLAFQNPNDQFFKARVRDELWVGIRMLEKNKNEWFKELCDILDLHGLLDRSPYRLSEGEKKRVALASIFAMRSNLIVLDEPTVGQDGRFREILAELLAKLQDLGFTILIVTHDLEFARATTDRWVVMHEGKIAADGSPRDLWHNTELIRMGALGHTR